jgi:UDP-N-acetylmuramoylalanine-D-glutamate ligase
MGKLRFYLALVAARFIYLAIKLLNKSSGTSFVGMSVLKICPDFLRFCRNYVTSGHAITVTGTNGKTTTSGLIAHIFETDKNKVLHNLKGANMLTGVANAFALNIIPARNFDYAVIE